MKRVFTYIILALFVVGTLTAILYVTKEMRNRGQVEIIEEPVEVDIQENIVEDEITLESKKIELHSIFSPTYWDDWNWESKMVQVQVAGTQSDYNQLLVYAKKPDTLPFSGQYVELNILCKPEETFVAEVVDPGVKIVKENIDLFAEVTSGDMIYGRCETPSCLNLGSLCVIVKYKSTL